MKANIPASDNPRIVIVGGGFGGLRLAYDLAGSDYQVVLIDKNNYHQFQPLFYQVATAGLEPSSIVFPFRRMFQKIKNVHFRLASVTHISTESKRITTDLGEIPYDYLVLATGAGTNFFGNEHIERLSFPMKSIGEALVLRNSLFLSFENALGAETEEEKERFLNVVVVGGGPTGVEVAGTIAEMKRFILPRDYPEMDFSSMHITLVESSPKVLNGMSEKSSIKSLEYLKKLGVEVRLNVIVEDYDGNTCFIKGGEQISTKNLVWAAGIIGNKVSGLQEESYVRGGRIQVNRFNQVDGPDGVYVLGDVAYMPTEKYPNGHPQVAQGAIQQARNLAKNLKAITQNKKLHQFEYKNLGSMATVGRNKAVVDLPKRHFSGFFAWLVWMVVHLRSILGKKNKFLVFLNWVWNYLTYNLSLRLIIQNPKREEESKTTNNPQ
ncbi:MAG: NAD(P)/FAD-dependent oxidoreductase [Flavobacteriales bacterium]|jgi:NADH:ubiquinone reductase (H+-translocating)